ncbi:MAG: H(+)/Cl(-) exchange transporter ClcA [Acidaminococcaceae bacterium]|nr:H(+)/Cl(-) exchange transporter ClcA [Acidaminococcaceae bacterium]
MRASQQLDTYKNLNNWKNFRLRLFWEGILVGIFSGCVVGFFRFGIHAVETYRGQLYLFLQNNLTWTNLVALVVSAFVIAGLLSWLIKFEPLSGGSGIPQVKGNILGLYKTVWWRILLAKLVGGIVGIGAGLSLGREGPSIQLGAMTGQGLSRSLGRTRMEERYLISSGAGAGLAAAFNAPLAGVIFTLEELHKNFSAVVLLPTLAAALTATVISHGFFGTQRIFTIPAIAYFPVHYLYIIVIMGICLGFIGVFFNYSLLKASEFYQAPIFKHTYTKALLPLLMAIPLGFYLPEVLGGGNSLVDALVANPTPLEFLLVLIVGKFIYTMFSYGCGVPGGFFLPMLVLGALSGNILGTVFIDLGLLAEAYRIHVIVFAMAGFFAASVRSPITGIVLILEMTGSFIHLVPLAIVAMCAYVVAELCHSKPIYDSLLEKALAAADDSNPAFEKKETRNIIEVAVESGSAADGKFVKDINWPERTLLVDVKRGEDDLVPSGDTRLKVGDYLYILADNEQAEDVRKIFE